MKTTSLSTIKIAPNRQRKEFDATKLYEFGEKIIAQGLFHPIILRKTSEGFTLVAGERRLRAVTDIYSLGGSFTHDGKKVPVDHIPYTLLTDLDELAAEEAELEENACREDLTWAEKAAAVARIASLRERQANARGEAPPSVADISIELHDSDKGYYHETVRRSLIVSKHLDKPEVKAATTLDEAFKVLKRAEKKKKDAAQGVRVGKTFTSKLHTALNADALVWLSGCASDQFDVILTDPPYGMGADAFGNAGTTTAFAHTYEDTPDLYRQILATCQEHLYRICKPQAHMYWFCDLDMFHMTREAFLTAGWQVFRTPLIFYKRTGLRMPWTNGPQRKYECILYAVKGKRPVLKIAGDVLDFSSDVALGHQAQKPVALYTELLSRSILAGECVLDPFMGSGTIFAAAHELKAIATGIEVDPASFGVAIQRLEKLS